MRSDDSDSYNDIETNMQEIFIGRKSNVILEGLTIKDKLKAIELEPLTTGQRYLLNYNPKSRCLEVCLGSIDPNRRIFTFCLDTKIFGELPDTGIEFGTFKVDPGEPPITGMQGIGISDILDIKVIPPPFLIYVFDLKNPDAVEIQMVNDLLFVRMHEEIDILTIRIRKIPPKRQQ